MPGWIVHSNSFSASTASPSGTVAVASLPGSSATSMSVWGIVNVCGADPWLEIASSSPVAAITQTGSNSLSTAVISVVSTQSADGLPSVEVRLVPPPPSPPQDPSTRIIERKAIRTIIYPSQDSGPHSVAGGTPVQGRYHRVDPPEEQLAE